MSSVHEHYENVLSEHYSRMLGDFEAKVSEQRALPERLGVEASSTAGFAVISVAAPAFSPSRWRASVTGSWPSTSASAF